MKNKILTTLLVCFMVSITFSQGINPNLPQVIAPSPNAAALGIYGQIPVSLFSGLPQISIPIGGASVKNAQADISLNYHGGGVRPDIHPGWCGLGWDLSCGGVITRIVRGGADETLDPNSTPITNVGYYYNFSVADNANWANDATISSYLYPIEPRPMYPAPDEFTFNFGAYTGSFFLDHKGKWQVKSNSSIFLKIEEELKDYYVLPKQPDGDGDITLRRIFNKFSVTSPDGTKYVFGGTSESIEFSRSSNTTGFQNSFNSDVIPTSWFLTKIISPTGQEITFQYHRDGFTIALTSQIMRYRYKEGAASEQNYAFIGNKALTIINPCYLSKIITTNQTVDFYRSNSNELSFDYPPFLQKINFFTDLHNANASVSAYLKWRKLDSIRFSTATGEFMKKVIFYYTEQTASRLKLDSIKEVAQGNITKPPYIFSYDPTVLPVYNAQKLDHWGFYNGTNYFETNPKSNGLLYTNADVPAYSASRNSNLTLMKAGILTSVKYPTGGTTTFDYEPHDYSMAVGRYPFTVTNNGANAQCGGLRVKKITSTDPSTNPAKTVIKEYFYVKNYSTGGTLSSGIFTGIPKYLDEGSWTASGGVLSFWYWYDYGIEPLSFTNGNHVTYSEVAEKQADGGYTVYTYSNHDQSQYLDQAAVYGKYAAPGLWSMDPNTSMALERGKLLEKKEYKAGNILLRKQKTEYIEDSARFSEAVRIINITERTFGNSYDARGTAYLIYSFPQLVSRTTEDEWDQNGTNPVTTVTDFSYNRPYRTQIQQQMNNSKGETLKTTLKYPFDYISTSPVYSLMTAINMIAPVIESKKFNGANALSSVTTTYDNPYTGMFLPIKIDQQIKSNPSETVFRYLKYATNGNLLTFAKENDQKLSYDWAYNKEYPVVEIKNAENSLVTTTSPATINGSLNMPGTNSVWTSFTTSSSGSIVLTAQGDPGNAFTIRYELNGPSSKSGYLCATRNATTCSYPSTATFTGMPPGGYTLTLYDYSGSGYRTVTYSYTGTQTVTTGIKEFFFEGFEEHTSSSAVTGISHSGRKYWNTNYTTSYTKPNSRSYVIQWWNLSGGKWIFNQQPFTTNATLTGPLDDVRIFPADAMMSSYTYDPVIGMTSQTDPAGKTITYEYDSFSRLKTIRDQDKNVIRTMDYQYQKSNNQ